VKIRPLGDVSPHSYWQMDRQTWRS